MINFSIAGEAGSGVDVSLSVFTPRGGKIRTLLEGRLQPGDHTVTWDGRDDRGVQVPSSIYLYTLISGRERVTRKMTLCQ
jgi:flagellar hook assembly protein FlgD